MESLNVDFLLSAVCVQIWGQLLMHTYINIVELDEAFVDRIFPIWSYNSYN